jgi:hypothetical protein
MIGAIKQLQEKRQACKELLQLYNNIITADAELGVEISPEIKQAAIKVMHELQEINGLLNIEVLNG